MRRPGLARQRPQGPGHAQGSRRAAAIAEFARRRQCDLRSLVDFNADGDNSEERVKVAHAETSLQKLLFDLELISKLAKEAILKGYQKANRIDQLCRDAKKLVAMLTTKEEWKAAEGEDDYWTAHNPDPA